MSGGLTIGALLCDGGAALRAAGVEEPRREARLLLGHVLGRAAGMLTASSGESVAEPLARRYRALVARRAGREPFAYLVGRRGFWTLDLAVTPDVLVPRPETETLIEAALAWRPERRLVRRLVDLGTGSGALLLAALTEFPDALGIGVDRSASALAVAEANARATGLSARSLLVLADWSSALAAGADLVLCNPPYIASESIPLLQPEVARYEPRCALDGGPDGLHAYRAVLSDLPRLLAPGGIAVLELGAGQAGAVCSIAAAVGLAAVEIRQDLGGVLRAVVLRHSEKGVGAAAAAD